MTRNEMEITAKKHWLIFLVLLPFVHCSIHVTRESPNVIYQEKINFECQKFGPLAITAGIKDYCKCSDTSVLYSSNGGPIKCIKVKEIKQNCAMTSDDINMDKSFKRFSYVGTCNNNTTRVQISLWNANLTSSRNANLTSSRNANLTSSRWESLPKSVYRKVLTLVKSQNDITIMIPNTKLFSGQLIKVTFSCGECLIFAVKGNITYPFKISEIFSSYIKTPSPPTIYSTPLLAATTVKISPSTSKITTTLTSLKTSTTNLRTVVLTPEKIPSGTNIIVTPTQVIQVSITQTKTTIAMTATVYNPTKPATTKQFVEQTSNTNVGIISALAVVSVIVILLVVIIIVIVFRRRKQPKKSNQNFKKGKSNGDLYLYPKVSLNSTNSLGNYKDSSFMQLKENMNNQDLGNPMYMEKHQINQINNNSTNDTYSTIESDPNMYQQIAHSTDGVNRNCRHQSTASTQETRAQVTNLVYTSLENSAQSDSTYAGLNSTTPNTTYDKLNSAQALNSGLSQATMQTPQETYMAIDKSQTENQEEYQTIEKAHTECHTQYQAIDKRQTENQDQYQAIVNLQDSSQTNDDDIHQNELPDYAMVDKKKQPKNQSTETGMYTSISSTPQETYEAITEVQEKSGLENSAYDSFDQSENYYHTLERKK